MFTAADRIIFYSAFGYARKDDYERPAQARSRAAMTNVFRCLSYVPIISTLVYAIFAAIYLFANGSRTTSEIRAVLQTPIGIRALISILCLGILLLPVDLCAEGMKAYDRSGSFRYQLDIVIPV